MPTPLYGCGIGQATGWRPANATTVALQNRDGVCLDAKQRGQNGGSVQMWACDPTNLNQRWNIDVATGLIKNRDGVCLKASSDRSQPGGAVIMWACDPTDRNQQWQFDPATDLGSCGDPGWVLQVALSLYEKLPKPILINFRTDFHGIN